MKTSIRRVVTGITVLFALLVPALGAHADSDESGDTTWAVAPADANGPDGRRMIEDELDPGESATDRFAVTNLSTHEVTFKLRAADGYFNENGRFNTIASDQESVDIGTWVEMPDEITVAPQESAVVPFTVTVPEDAEPGDHAAGISASLVQVTTDEDGSTVGVESRVGFRLTVTVTGAVRTTMTIQDIRSTYDTSWNPVRPGAATVTFKLVNEGNIRMLGQGVLRLGGREVVFPAEGEPKQELLPGDERSFTLRVDGLWPTFVVSGSVDATPAAAGERAAEVTIPPVSGDVSVVAIPWPQLAVLLGLILIVFALVWNRGRNKRRVADLVAQAREEGRQAANEENQS